MTQTQQPPLNSDERAEIATDEQIAARYPEHQKYTKEVDRDVMMAQSFITWLQDKGIELCHVVAYSDDYYAGGEYVPLAEPRKLAFTWKGIDYDAFFREKEDMYRQMAMRQEEATNGNNR